MTRPTNLPHPVAQLARLRTVRAGLTIGIDPPRLYAALSSVIGALEEEVRTKGLTHYVKGMVDHGTNDEPTDRYREELAALVESLDVVSLDL